MKVYIGPYKNWFGPHQLAEKICFWAKKKPDENGLLDKPKYVSDLGEWLAYGKVIDVDECLNRTGKIDGIDLDAFMAKIKDRMEHETWLYKFLRWVDSKKQRKIEVRIDKYDTWSMDHTLAHIIHPMLLQLQKTQHGSGLVDDEDVPEELRSTSCAPKQNEWDVDNNHFRRWDWALSEMIFAFESHINDDYDELLDSDERRRNGFRLFGKYYQNLWD